MKHPRARSLPLKLSAFVLSLAFSWVLAAGCAVPRPAADQVLTPLPGDWPELVLAALPPRAAEDALKYEPGGVSFSGTPQPCVLEPVDKSGRAEPVRAHCGNMTVTPAGRARLPPVNYIFLLKEDNAVEFIRQD